MNKRTFRNLTGLLLSSAVGVTLLAGCNGGSGDQGPAGATGFTGAEGPTGANGGNGSNGTTGETGANGSVGSTGSTGSTGAAGTPAGGYVFVATSIGVESFTVDPSGNLHHHRVHELPNGHGAAGLAITPNQQFLVVTTQGDLTTSPNDGTAGLYVFAIDPSSGDLNATVAGGTAPVLPLNATDTSGPIPAGSIAINPEGTEGVFGDSSGLLESFSISTSGAITVQSLSNAANYPDGSPTESTSVAITNVGGNDIALTTSGTNIVSFTLAASGNLTDNSSGNNTTDTTGATINFVAAQGSEVGYGDQDDVLSVTTLSSNNALSGDGSGTELNGTSVVSGAMAQIPGVTGETVVATTNTAPGSVFLGDGTPGVNFFQVVNSTISDDAATVSSTLLTSNVNASVALVADTNGVLQGFVLPVAGGVPSLFPAILTDNTFGGISLATVNNMAAANFP